ncbi:MAG: hypothetical protein OXI73_00520, partial [Rhodospirillales bacterium]|nr:hypothetical protein [Rhodospirillales bacterium]
KVCLAAVFAIGLAACSSSDNGDTGMTPTDPPPTATEQELADLKDQIADLREQLGLEADGDIGDSVAELQAEITRLQGELQDQQDAMDTAARKAAAAEALALFNSFTDTVGDTTDADGVTVTVTAVSDTDGGGGSAEITATTALVTAGGDALGPTLGGDDVVRTAQAMLGMWQGTMLTDADMAGNSSTAVVYTDVGANTGRPWAEVYTNVDSQTVATLLGVNANAAVLSSAFSTAGLKDHHGDRNMTSNLVTVSGTFDGASGAYTCTSATAGTCTSNLTSDGVVLSAAWSFNPVDTAMVSQPDMNYAYFGWWLNKTASGNPEVDVFHGGSAAEAVDITATEFTALGGTATYEGAAIGKYAMNRGADQYASGGHWTAEATLTANFEGAAVTDAGSISGMIDNFMADGEAMNWSVKLNMAPIADLAGRDFGLAADGTEWTIDGAAAADAGSWEGDFHNQVAPPDGNNVPGTVTGEFTATYGAVGHMIGAFGAHVE